jgi:hypothetical protein
VKGVVENPVAVGARSRRFPAKLALFGCLAVTSVFFGFLKNSWADAGALLQHFGYYVLTGTFLWWLYSLSRLGGIHMAKRFFSWEFLRSNWSVLAVIGLLTLVAELSVPYSYKILYDELVLQSTALNLHFFREIATVATGYEVEGVFRSINVYVDKRPFFFPYLISLLHDLTGFRASNGFFLNTLLMPVALGLYYTIARSFGGRKIGLAGLICFGATALMAQNANGVGMEMLNVCMILLTLGLSIHYLNAPSEDRLSALVLSCVLLAQTRYESAAYVIPVSLVILEGWRRAGRIIMPLAGLVAPVMLIPCALQNVYLSGMPALWDLHDDTTSRFDTSFVVNNLSHAFRYFFVVSSDMLNSVWLSVLGFLGMGWAIWKVIMNLRAWRTASPLAVASILIGLCAVGNLGMLMFYYWGQLDDVLVFRLALPLNIIQGLAIAWAISQLPVAWAPRVAGWVIAGGLLFYMALGLPSSARHRNANYIATEIAWGEKWVARQPDKPRLIIVSTTALNWFLQKTAALSFNYATQRASGISFHMKAGTFQEVLAFQYYRPTGPGGAFVLDPRTELPPSFVLEPLVERSLGSKLLRISRVVEIKADEQTKAVIPPGQPVTVYSEAPSSERSEPAMVP